MDQQNPSSLLEQLQTSPQQTKTYNESFDSGILNSTFQDNQIFKNYFYKNFTILLTDVRNAGSSPKNTPFQDYPKLEAPSYEMPWDFPKSENQFQHASNFHQNFMPTQINIYNQNVGQIITHFKGLTICELRSIAY